MERNDYIHIFNKFLENKATPSEIKLLIEWLKERKAFDTWADDIWMQSPMEMDPSVKQHLLDELRKQIFFTSNPQLSSSASFLRLNVLSSLN